MGSTSPVATRTSAIGTEPGILPPGWATGSAAGSVSGRQAATRRTNAGYDFMTLGRKLFRDAGGRLGVGAEKRQRFLHRLGDAPAEGSGDKEPGEQEFHAGMLDRPATGKTW